MEKNKEELLNKWQYVICITVVCIPRELPWTLPATPVQYLVFSPTPWHDVLISLENLRNVTGAEWVRIFTAVTMRALAWTLIEHLSFVMGGGRIRWIGKLKSLFVTFINLTIWRGFVELLGRNQIWYSWDGHVAVEPWEVGVKVELKTLALQNKF